MVTRDEIHRLLDGVPNDRVAPIGEIPRAAREAGLTGDQAHRLAKQTAVRSGFDTPGSGTCPQVCQCRHVVSRT